MKTFVLGELQLVSLSLRMWQVFLRQQQAAMLLKAMWMIVIM